MLCCGPGPSLSRIGRPPKYRKVPEEDFQGEHRSPPRGPPASGCMERPVIDGIRHQAPGRGETGRRLQISVFSAQSSGKNSSGI